MVTLIKTSKCSECGEAITEYMAECFKGICVDCHAETVGPADDVEDEAEEVVEEQDEEERTEELRDQVRDLAETLDPEAVLEALRVAGLIR